MVPEIDLPAVHSFESVIQQAKERAGSRKARAALVVPSDTDALRAFASAARDQLVDPVIIGDESLLSRNAEASGVDVSKIPVIDVNQPDMAVRTAGHMVDSGDLDIIVQGRVRMAEMLSLLLERESGFRLPGKTVSHVAVMKPRDYPTPLLLTDGGVVVLPDLKTKLSLLGNMVYLAEKIGVTNPRIAAVAAVEVVYPQMQATLDGAILAKMAERGQIKGARVDGPLSFDVAVDMAAAHAKGITNSPVAGQADGLLAPCIEVANGVYNAMTLYGHCEIGGIIVGGKVPLAVNTRADSEQARYNSIVLATLAC